MITKSIGGGAEKLSDLKDINLADINDRKMLQYDGDEEEWVCVDPPDGPATGWQTVAASDFVAIPAFAGTITMLADLTSTIKVGMSLRYTQNGVEYFGQVVWIDDDTLYVSAPPLSTEHEITNLQFGGGQLTQIHLKVDGIYGAYNDNALLLNKNAAPLMWLKSKSYVVMAVIWVKVGSSHANKGYVNIGINGQPLLSGGSTPNYVPGDWAYSGEAAGEINANHYAVDPYDSIDLACVAGYTELNSDKLCTLGNTLSLAPYNQHAWSSPTNIYSSNNSYASVTEASFDTGRYTHVLRASTFRHSIPADAVIWGIKVLVEKRGANGQAVDALISLSKNNTEAVGENKADTSTPWPASDTIVTYGSETDKWGVEWTAAEINSDDFAVWLAVQAIQDDADVYVDAVQTIVYYSLPDDAQELCVSMVLLTP